MSFESPNKVLIIPTVFCIIFVLAFIVFQIWRRRRPVIKIEQKCVLWTYIGLLILTVVLSVIGLVVILLITGWKDLNADVKDLNQRVKGIKTRIDSSKGNIPTLSTSMFDFKTVISNQPADGLANVKIELKMDEIENKKLLDTTQLGQLMRETWRDAFLYQLIQCNEKITHEEDFTKILNLIEDVETSQRTISEAMNIQKNWQKLADKQDDKLGSTQTHVTNYMSTVPPLLDQFQSLFESSRAGITDTNKKNIDALKSYPSTIRVGVLVLSIVAVLISIAFLIITIIFNFKYNPPNRLHILFSVILVIITIISVALSVVLVLCILNVWNIAYTCSTPAVPNTFNSTFTTFKGNSTPARNVFDQCIRTRKVFSLSKVNIEAPPILNELGQYEIEVNENLLAISKGRDDANIEELRKKGEKVMNVKKELDAFTKKTTCLKPATLADFDKALPILADITTRMTIFMESAKNLRSSHSKVSAAMNASFNGVRLKIESAIKAFNANLKLSDFECTDFVGIFAKKGNEICDQSNEFFNQKLLIGFSIVLVQYTFILLFHLISCILLIIKDRKNDKKTNGKKLENSKNSKNSETNENSKDTKTPETLGENQSRVPKPILPGHVFPEPADGKPVKGMVVSFYDPPRDPNNMPSPPNE